jgi:hypothetical protein
MRPSDPRYEGYASQHDLAMVMRSKGARLNTVMRWTGLTRYRVQKLTRFYQQSAPDDHRRRGISPSQSAYFAKSLRLEAESLAFALIAYELKVIPDKTAGAERNSLPDVERGWRLIWAYAAYERWVPGAQIGLERAILLVRALTRRSLVIRRCRTCPDVMVVDRLGVQHDRCPSCRSAEPKAVASDPKPTHRRARRGK